MKRLSLQGFREFSGGVRGLASVLALMGLSACGLDVFSTSSGHRQVNERRVYRKARPQCSGLDLSSERMSPGNFRTLIRCLNGNRSIPELQALVDEASDEQLQPMVQILNEGFLSQPKLIRQSYQLLTSLDKQGELDPLLGDLAGFLSSSSRLRALLQLLDPADKGLISFLSGGDRLALERDLQNLSARDARESLRWVLSVTSSPSGRSFIRKFSEASLTETEKEELARGFKNLTAWAVSPEGRRVLREMVSPQHWPNFKRWMIPDSNEEIAKRATEIRDLSHELFNKTSSWSALSQLEGTFRAPISCFSGGRVFQEPFSEALLSLEAEKRALAPFLFRFVPLTALHARSFCDVPDTFLASYPKFLNFLSGSSGGPFLDFLKVTLEDRSTRDFRELLFSRQGEGPMIAPLKALARKDLVGDGYLLFTAIDPQGMEWIRRKAQQVSLSQLSPWTIQQWQAQLGLLGEVLQGDPDPYLKALARVDQLFSVGEGHYWFEGMRRLLLLSLRQELSLRGLSGLSQLQSFDRAVNLLKTMAEDGRMVPLILNTLQVFGGAKVESPSGVTELTAGEALTFSPRHLLSTSDLSSGVRPTSPADSFRGCLRLDLRKPVHLQSALIRECQGSSADLTSWQGAFDEMGRASAYPGSRLSLLGVLEKEIRFPKIGKSDARALVEWLRDGMRTGSFGQGLESLRLVLLGSSRESGLLLPWAQALGKMQRSDPTLLEQTRIWWGKALQKENASAFLRSLEQVFSKSSAIPPRAGMPNLDRVRLARWIRNKECILDGQGQSRRLSELIWDYQNSLSGWEEGNRVGRSRHHWDEASLIPRVNRVLERLKAPRVHSAIQKTFRSLSLLPGERRTQDRRWSAGEAIRFFELRAKDAQPVPYLYSGKDVLHLRLMSSLDRLESILTSANFTFPYLDGLRIRLGDNFAMKFMAMIGEAYGDSPRELWPIEIQKKYPAPLRPKTQREVYLEMKEFLERYSGLGGLPSTRRCDPVVDSRDPPETQKAESWEPSPLISAPDWIVSDEVKARLYNLIRALPVIEENLPGSSSPQAGGMLFLRDLFWTVHSASAPEARSPRDSAGNQLGLILELGDLGFLRLLSLAFSGVQDPVERTALVALLGAGGSVFGGQEGPRILQALFADQPREIRAWTHWAIRESLRAPERTLSLVNAGLYLGAHAARIGIASELAPELSRIIRRALSLSPPELASGTPHDWKPLAERLRGLYARRDEDLHQRTGAFLRELLLEARGMNLLERGLQQAWDRPEVAEHWAQVWQSIERVCDSSEYRRLGGEALLLSFLRRVMALQSGAWMRNELSRMILGDLGRAMLYHSTQDPSGVERWVRGAFDALQGSRGRHFFEVIERHL